MVSKALLTILDEWEEVVYNNYDEFNEIFCRGQADYLTGVYWNCRNLKLVYIDNTGQKLTDSFKIEKWMDFLKEYEKD